MSQRGGYVGELVVAQSYENLDDSIDVAVAAGDDDVVWQTIFIFTFKRANKTIQYEAPYIFAYKSRKFVQFF